MNPTEQDMTEIKLVSLEERSSAESQNEKGRTTATHTATHPYMHPTSRDSDISLLQPKPVATHWHQPSYTNLPHSEFSPAASVSGYPHPPRAVSYFNGSDTRSSSPYPAAHSPFVSILSEPL